LHAKTIDRGRNLDFSKAAAAERIIMNSAKYLDKTEPREIRRKLGLNQQQFWSKIGVTQSGGSRYESGRNMPKPVRELLRLVHVEQIDIQRIKREDVDLVEYLKSAEAELYKTLKKSAKSKRKAA
jgi:DNA-binding transcriptional regulator YiaG